VGNRAVVKFGGADLSSGERIREAAQMVIKSGYKEVVVVVSAIGKTTDSLAEIMSQIGVSDSDYAEIVSMGERTSARIFCSALRSLGAEAVYFDPAHGDWSIITDSNFRDAKPNLEKTKVLVKKHLESLLGKTIPVVCGFLGRDKHGNITTLGRGGSDTTALLIANCLEADEVILVKNTDGVLSADPKIVSNARMFDELDIHEMFALAQGGAKVLRPEALRYKLPNQKLRVVSFSSNNLSKGGTDITGVFYPNSAEISQHEGLSAVTVVCTISPENLSKLFSALRQNAIYGVSTGKKSVTVFACLTNAKETVNMLHSLKNFKAISCKDKVGMIEVTHPVFIDSPGWVAKITNTLASKGINILEVTTSKATINLFIEESRLKDALKAVGEAFET
jgi:aspartate kinase